MANERGVTVTGLLSVVLSCAALSASAQETEGLASGSSVRLALRSQASAIEGRTVSEWRHLDQDLLISDKNGRTVTISPSDISRLERMTRPSRRGKGAIIGGLIAGGGMAALAGIACSDLGDCDGGAVVGSIALAGAVGAGLGAAIAPGARWEIVQIAGPNASSASGTSAGPTASRRRVVRFSIRF